MDTRLDEMPIETVVEAIEGNLFALFKSFGALPGAEVSEDGHALSFRTGLDSPMFNGVAHAQFPSDGDLGGKIEKTLAPFKERNLPMFWWTGPASQPLDLDEQLQSYDMVPYAVNMAGMAADLSSLSRVSNMPAGLVIEQVESEEALKEWGHAFSLSHDWPTQYADAWVSAATSLGLGDSPLRLYLGRLGDGGEAVAVSAMFLSDDVAGIYNVGTVSLARRRGIGSAMVTVPLREANELGYGVGILHAEEGAENVYRKLGFKEFCRINCYTLA